MDSIHERVATSLRRIRREKGFSLDKAAEITGVSKAMLGQIERGESNPTVTTLWKIANGFQVSFSSFVEEDTTPVFLISGKALQPLLEEEGQYRVYPLFPFDPIRRFEIFSIVLEPGCRHASEAHPKGVEEYLLVSEGTLEVEVEESLYTVYQGDALRFPGDRPHGYRNGTTALTQVQVVIYYPL